MFKNHHSFDDRLFETKRILEKYPDRVPVICEKCKYHRDLPDIDKNKYLVPCDMSLGQFMYVIRKRMPLLSEEALFFIIGNTISSSSLSMAQLYEYHKDPDGYLYIQYTKENTFGF
jgi:GABA(A) receptor-associated protein